MAQLTLPSPTYLIFISIYVLEGSSLISSSSCSPNGALQDGLCDTISTSVSLSSLEEQETEEEVGGQHQRVDMPGLLRDTKGGRRQEEVETVGYKVIGGIPTTLRVTGLID